MDNIKFDFDDMLIVPKEHGDISSRYKDIVLPDKLPLFTAPMDTVVNYENKDVFLKNKINVVLPRTVLYNTFLAKEVLAGKTQDDGIFVSFGLNELQDTMSTQFFHEEAKILIDMANGHMQQIIDTCRKIKKYRPDITIMVGNIANPQTYRWYVENDCVDYIRVGIGNGNGCLTSKQSGVGYPLASLIRETFHEKLLCAYDFPGRKLPAIVADGGMKDYADIIKALALGADYVMIGSIFNKALESCADNYVFGMKVNDRVANYCFDKKIPIMKHFRGMSTKEAQKAMGKTRFKTSEGVTRFRKVEYRLSGWVENFEHYLRNAMSYSNARTLNEFIGRAEICQITDKAYVRLNK